MCELQSVVKALLKDLGMTQVELCELLNRLDRRLNLYPSELSRYLRGNNVGKKGAQVLQTSVEVLTDTRKKRDAVVQAAKEVLNK